MRKLISVQLSLLLFTAIAIGLVFDWRDGMASAWGGLIAMINSLLLARAVHKASRAALRSGKAGMAHLYIGFIGRFAIIVVGMTLGIAHWGLAPIPIIVGLAVVSLGAALTERLT